MRAKDAVASAVERRPSGAGRKVLKARPLPLLVEIGDPSMAGAVVSAGARLGVAITIGDGGRPLRLDALGTIAHAIRVAALAEIGVAFGLSGELSARARRLLATHASKDGGAILGEEPGGRVSLVARGITPIDLGEPPEADAAIREARARSSARGGAPGKREVEVPIGAEERARGVAFGPARTLSEPSSRRVLEAFGLSFGRWQLAENAARAAFHARTIGYPIDLRLASPDLSAIDDAALSALELRTPGEVREGVRAIVRAAQRASRRPRILGVTVARSILTSPRLRIAIERDERAEGAAARMTIALDDPVGSKLARPIVADVPRDLVDTEALLARFEGRDALPGGDTPRGRALVETIARLAKIARDLPDVLVRAEVVGVAPIVDDVGWAIAGARARVRGVEIEGSGPA